MPRGFAWLLGLAVLAAAWWFAGHPGWHHAEPPPPHNQTSDDINTSKLYRWRDENGITQITQTPPKGRKYSVVSIRDDQNIIEGLDVAPEPPK